MIVELLNVGNSSEKSHAFVPNNKVTRFIVNKKKTFERLAILFPLLIITSTFQTNICLELPPVTGSSLGLQLVVSFIA